MAEEYGPTFITVTDEDGREIVLEFIDALEYNGQQYQAFFPAETEGEDEDDPDNEMCIRDRSHGHPHHPNDAQDTFYLRYPVAGDLLCPSIVRE